MLAYALISKPCSEATDIGYIFFGGSICSNFGKYAVVCSLPNELNSNLSLDKS